MELVESTTGGLLRSLSGIALEDNEDSELVSPSLISSAVESLT